MSELIESIERRQMRRELPPFRMGDRVRVHFQVIEGSRRRTQVFEGVVIRVHGAGSRRTFTVRKISFGVGVERTFPVHTPKIERLEIVGRGEVRRAKLYYLRGRIGRRARLRERRDVTPEELAAAVPAPAADGAEQEPAPDAASAEEASEDVAPVEEAAAEELAGEQGAPEGAANEEDEEEPPAAEAEGEPQEEAPDEHPADDRKEA